MLAISWNVRGLGKCEKRKVVCRMVAKYKLVVVFLQETKLSVFDSSVIRSQRGAVLTRGVWVDAEGASGGLITLWNEDRFMVHSCISSNRYIILEGELTGIKKKGGLL
ncbi:hypothetical protein Dsin_013371 [Dipteronia sinensis]|uniref:Endonuclease/exonuclease/phosphatase domain-containing protein n=1 Tax=Dipteronia sinensis TaxID=43782 RepID=A0AAE0AJT0_9ROSI|nr:hypothetical protein Dsin_013371 [Dipteronia sinensis]